MDSKLNSVPANFSTLNNGNSDRDSNDNVITDDQREEEFELMIERLLTILQDPKFKGCPVKDTLVIDDYSARYNCVPTDDWLKQLEDVPEIDKMVYNNDLVLLAIRSKLSRKLCQQFKQSNGHTNHQKHSNGVQQMAANDRGQQMWESKQNGQTSAENGAVVTHFDGKGDGQNGNSSTEKKTTKKSVTFGLSVSVQEFVEDEKAQENGGFLAESTDEIDIEEEFPSLDLSDMAPSAPHTNGHQISPQISPPPDGNVDGAEAEIVTNGRIMEQNETTLTPMHGIDEKFMGRVVSAFDPFGFTIQVEDFTPMNEYFRDALKIAVENGDSGISAAESDLQEGFYAVLSEGAWHRAFVGAGARRRNGLHRAFLVDRGEYVMTHNATPLPKTAFIMPMLAVRCVLSGVVPADARDRDWSAKAANTFVEMVIGKTFDVEIEKPPEIWQEAGSPRLPLIQVRLSSSSGDVAEAMVKQGLGRFKE